MIDAAFFDIHVTTLLTFTGFVILVTLLGWIAYLVQKRSTYTSLTPEEAKRTIIRAEERAQNIIAEANAAVRQTRLEIEKERTRALNEDHESIERFLDAYRFRLDKMIKELSYGVEKEHLRATSRFVESLQSIEGRVSLNADEAKHSMDSFTTQSGALFDKLVYEIENVEKGIQHLSTALEEAAANESDKNAEIVRAEMRKIGEETARSVVAVARGLDETLRVNLEKEFNSMRDDIAKYRETRMRLIDERILVLIEETAHIALQKKLSMEDQSELVYRSLEEAKERGVFV